MECAQLSETSELWFNDSGPVTKSTNYTTVILLHGMGLNQGIFQKCLPLGAAQNLRLVSVNRHGYSGSSPHVLSSESASWKELAADTAAFLAWFIKNKEIPKFDGSHGGIAILAWSLAASTALSLLAYKDAIKGDVHAGLSDYFRTIIMYEPPHHAFGRRLSYDDGYNPLADHSIASPEARQAAFPVWVSSYYDHPDLSSRTLNGLDRTSPMGRSPTFAKFTKEENAQMTDASGMTADAPVFFPSLAAVISKQTEQAFFDQETTSQVFPSVKVVWITGTCSPWNLVHLHFCMEEEYKQKLQENPSARPLKFVEVDGANHFLNWDDPERFVRVVADNV